MSVVLFTEHPLGDNQYLLEICLNAERSLNALNLEMIDLMIERMKAAAEDPRIVALLLDSAGQKAFCAGGDVVSLYKASIGEGPTDLAEQFFTREYQLDYLLHSYAKPIICWGSGIVMGGGKGLLAGCSHKVVTETTTLAMPEVTIGLYPDVGGSWFLNRAPGRTGLFLGLTGARFNGADAQFLGLADRLISSDKRGQLVEALAAADWSGNSHHTVSDVLRALESESAIEMNSPVREHYDLIQQLTDTNTVDEFVERLLALETEDPWMVKIQSIVGHGSPLALKMIYRQLNSTVQLSLKEVLQAELVLSVQCALHREFPEGVRALLVDKDGKPDWTFKTLAEVDESYLDELFVSPWQQNPLADL